MKSFSSNIILLIALFAVSFFSCTSHKANSSVGFCYDNNIQNNCYSITFNQLLDSGLKYESKCIEIEGYLSLNFEDVAIYKSNKERKNLQSKDAYWLNFSDSLITCMESKVTALNKQKVIIKGVFTNKRKGHLNAYSGEIDNVFFVQPVSK